MQPLKSTSQVANAQKADAPTEATGSVPAQQVKAFASQPTLDGLRGLLEVWFAPFAGKTSLEVRGSVDGSETQKLQLHYSGPNHTFYLGDRHQSPLFAPSRHENGAMEIRHADLSEEGGRLFLEVALKSGSVTRWASDALRLNGIHNGYDPVFQTATFELEQVGKMARLRGVDFSSSVLPGVNEKSASVEFPDRLAAGSNIKGPFYTSIYK